MISVLICSNNPVLLDQIKVNIKNTIGTAFEILYSDNRLAQKGICKVYNELASRAKYPFLCFVHEDVIFPDNGWGNKLVDIFGTDTLTGLIGVAGSKYKSRYFSGWYCNVKELDCANIVHRYDTGDEKINYSPVAKNKAEQVICLDGVFMCCRSEVWKEMQFNDSFLKGFHFYDIDFSLRVAEKYNIVVSYEIEMIHITGGGNFDDQWVETAIAYHHLMKEKLPFTKIKVDRKVVDRKIIIAWLDWLKNQNISLTNRLKWIRLQKLYSNPVFYYSLLKFLFYKPLRLKQFHYLVKSK